MAKRQSPKLEDIEIPLSEPKGRLFPRPKNPDSNFSKTILTRKDKSARVGVLGSVKPTSNKKSVDRKKEVKHVIKLEQIVFGAMLSAAALYGIYSYTDGDYASIVVGVVFIYAALKSICNK